MYQELAGRDGGEPYAWGCVIFVSLVILFAIGVFAVVWSITS